MTSTRKNWATLPEAELIDEKERLVKTYMDASPVKAIAGRQALAEALATLVIHKRILSDLEAQGKLAAEESRTLPAVASNIGRITKQLGLDKQKEDSPFELE